MRLFKNSKPIYVFIIVVLCFLSFLVPQLTAYFIQDLNVYKNGWDEPTYLSYLGALGARNFPGYIQLYIVSFLHNIGLSGSTQNLIFDLFFPLGTVFYIARSLKYKYSLENYKAILVSAFIYFGPIMVFSLTSLKGLDYEWLVLFKKSNLPALRSLNPQFGYFILASSYYGYIKSRKLIWLFLPLPFLYFFVAIPYMMLVGLYILCKLFRVDKLKHRIAILFIFYIVGSFTLYKLFNIIYKDINVTAIHINQSSFLPNVTLSILLSFILGFLFIKKDSFFLLAAISMLLSFNTHVLTGVKILPWGFEQYSFLSMLFVMLGIILCKILIKHSYVEYIVYLLMMYILYLMLLSNGFSFKTFRWKIYNGVQLTESQLDKIKKQPMSVVIADKTIAGRLSYGIAGKPFLPFSYQYAFQSTRSHCNNIEEYHDKIIEYLSRSNEVERLTSFKKSIFQLESIEKSDVCKPFYKNSFEIMKPKVKTWLYFPSF